MAPERTKPPLLRPPRLALFVLLAILALPGAALASIAGHHRAGGASPGGCAATRKPAGRHSRRASKRACARLHARKHAVHAPAKATHGPASPPLELLPAGCEDGSLPGNTGGAGYSCEDGSAPSCEQGRPVPPSATGPPMCAVEPSDRGECAGASSGDCPTGESSCEDPGSGEASAGCEYAGEAVIGEEEE